MIRRVSVGWIAAGVLALSGAAHAQTVSHRVLGVVRQTETGQPVAGAVVTLQSGTDVSESTRSGPNGEYSVGVPFEGVYRIAVAAPDFIPCSEAPLTLVVGEKADNIADLGLCRVTSIAGTLVDSENKRPIRGLRVRAYSISYVQGNRMLTAKGSFAATDANGHFEIGGLRADEYFLQVDSPSTVESVVTAGADANAAKTAIRGYPRQFWPVTGGIQFATPLTTGGGRTLNVGDIALREEPLYQLSGSVPESACFGAAAYRITLTEDWGGVSYTQVATTDVACGGRFVIAKVAAGDYRIEATPAPTRERGPDVLADSKVQIRDRDEMVDVVPRRPLAITGRLAVPSGFPENAKANLRTLAVRRGATLSDPVSVTGAAPFELRLRSIEAADLRISGLPAGYYASEILYNGAGVKDALLEPNAYAATQELKIVIAAQAATMSGKLTNSAAFSAMQVVMVAWPVRMKAGFPVNLTAAISASGEFSLGGISPDTYHVIAVSSAMFGRELQRPGMLAELAKSGIEVVLGPGDAKTLSLEIADGAR